LQKYNASGVAQTGAIVATSLYIYADQTPAVAELRDGGFAVSWVSLIPGEAGWEVYVQQYNSSLSAVGPVQAVHGITFGSQFQPDIVALDDGGYIVSWVTAESGVGDQGAYSQRFTAQGVAVENTLELRADAGDNVIHLGTADERVLAGQGNDSVFAGSGVDTVLYAGSQHDFEITILLPGDIRVKDQNSADGNEGTDSLHDVERLSFSGSVSLNAAVWAANVNTLVRHQQTDPSIARLEDGGYVICWDYRTNGTNNIEVHAQRFGVVGNFVGDEFLVNSSVGGLRFMSTVEGLADGGYIIGWVADDQNNQARNVYVQRYSVEGIAVGGETQVNVGNGYCLSPSIAAQSDGGYVISWQTYDANTSSYSTQLQHFGSAGVPSAPQQQIDSAGQSFEALVGLVTLNDGSNVVCIQKNDPQGITSVFTKAYDAEGQAIGDFHQIAGASGSFVEATMITALSDGGYVVGWSTYHDDLSRAYIYAQRFDASGVSVSEVTELRPETRFTAQTAICPLQDGGYVIGWVGVVSGRYNYYTQQFDATGALDGETQLVNSITSGSVRAPSLEGLSDGGYLASWTEDGADGFNSGILSKRFDANNNPVLDYLEWTGDASANIIRTSAQTDWFTGFAGNDIFQFAQAPQYRADLITDFTQGADTVALNSGVFNLQGQTVADSLANVTGNAHEAAGAHLVFNQDDHTLYYDADGAANGNAVAVVTLAGVAQVTGTDIQLYS
jgi:hypothetical protein